jgi:hypothetical protein
MSDSAHEEPLLPIEDPAEDPATMFWDRTTETHDDSAEIRGSLAEAHAQSLLEQAQARAVRDAALRQ